MVPSGRPNQIKGNILMARMEYVIDRGGEETLDRVLARMPAPDREVLKEPLLPVGLYPIELNLRLDDAIADELSPGDRNRVFLDMGRASADMNLRSFHRTFVKEGDPHFLLRCAPQIYRFYYTIGHRTYERTGTGSCVLRTYDAENVTITDCLTIVGWHTRAIEICGGKNVRIAETHCRARGGDRCEYHCSWD
jgi:uncharacterized protein (TIGR02265 family)